MKRARVKPIAIYYEVPTCEAVTVRRIRERGAYWRRGSPTRFKEIGREAILEDLPRYYIENTCWRRNQAVNRLEKRLKRDKIPYKKEIKINDFGAEAAIFTLA